MFLSAYEIQIMVADFETLLKSPEATPVRLIYYSRLGSEGPIDPVYKTEVINPQATPQEVTHPTIQDVIDTEKLKKYPAGFVKEGDAVFYFSRSVNLEEPVGGFPVVWESLVLKDALDLEWKPKLIAGGLASFHHLYRVGTYQIAQAVACSVLK